MLTWGFPKTRGTFLGVLIIRIIVFWGLHWGSLMLGNYHILSRHPTYSSVPPRRVAESAEGGRGGWIDR